MVEIEIDGKKVEVPEGSMVMHAAEKAGTYIPHFCYHKKLNDRNMCSFMSDDKLDQLVDGLRNAED